MVDDISKKKGMVYPVLYKNYEIRLFSNWKKYKK